MDFRKRYVYNAKQDLLGKGGFSRVFKATDVLLEREVALKVFNPEQSAQYDLITEIKKVIKFQQENLCRYYDVAILETVNAFGEEEQVQVGVMEYLDGGELKSYLKQNPQYLNKLLCDVLKGLSYLHKRSIIHRDLKPQNILIRIEDDGPVAKITDFGISKALGAAQENASALVGTVEYMAPEQFNPARYGIDGQISTHIDLWSFGIMVYELVEGENLFGSRSKGTSAEIVMTNILNEDYAQKLASLPKPYNEVVALCLKKRAVERAESADVLLRILSGNITDSSQFAGLTTRLNRVSHDDDDETTMLPGAQNDSDAETQVINYNQPVANKEPEYVKPVPPLAKPVENISPPPPPKPPVPEYKKPEPTPLPPAPKPKEPVVQRPVEVKKPEEPKPIAPPPAPPVVQAPPPLIVPPTPVEVKKEPEIQKPVPPPIIVSPVPIEAKKEPEIIKPVPSPVAEPKPEVKIPEPVAEKGVPTPVSEPPKEVAAPKPEPAAEKAAPAPVEEKPVAPVVKAEESKPVVAAVASVSLKEEAQPQTRNQALAANADKHKDAVAQPTPVATAAVPVNKNVKPKEKGKSNILVIVAVVAVIAIGAVFFVLKGKNEETVAAAPATPKTEAVSTEPVVEKETKKVTKSVSSGKAQAVTAQVFDAGTSKEYSYTGKIKNGVPDGKGVQKFTDGSTYSGTFSGGEHSGRGSLTWANGDKYVGSWAGGKKISGTFYYADGSMYKGSFKNDVKHGSGKFMYKDGSYYEGQFANDEFNGEGKLYNSDGELTKGGTFKNGEFQN